MPRVIFTKNYDFTPSAKPRSVVAYLASEEPQPVTQECADAAIKAGAAKLPTGETNQVRGEGKAGNAGA